MLRRLRAGGVCGASRLQGCSDWRGSLYVACLHDALRSHQPPSPPGEVLVRGFLLGKHKSHIRKGVASSRAATPAYTLRDGVAERVVREALEGLDSVLEQPVSPMGFNWYHESA